MIGRFPIEARLERWQRNLWAVWPSMFVVSLGLMAVIPTLPLYIRERFAVDDPDEVASWTALVFGAGPLAAAFSGPLWGALGDVVGRRIMVLRSMFAIAVVMALLPLAPTPGWMVVLRAVQGVFAGYVAPAMALVLADAPAERQGWAIARMQLALAMGLAFGPMMGAELSARLGRGAEFYAAAILSMLSVVIIALFAREERSTLSRRDGEGVLRAMLGGLVDTLGNRVFLVLLALILAMRFAIHMIEPFLALWVEELGPLSWLAADGIDDHGLARTTALAFTIVAVAQLLFTTSWGRLADRIGPLLGLGIVSLGLAVVLALTSTVHDIGAFLLLRCVAALFMAGAMTLAFAAVAKRVSPLRKSVALALVASCTQLGLSLGPICGAPLSHRIGLRGLYVVAAVVLLAAGAGMLILRAARPNRRTTVAVPRADVPT